MILRSLLIVATPSVIKFLSVKWILITKWTSIMFHSVKCHDISVSAVDFNNEVDMNHVELSAES